MHILNLSVPKLKGCYAKGPISSTIECAGKIYGRDHHAPTPEPIAYSLIRPFLLRFRRNPPILFDYSVWLVSNREGKVNWRF